MVDRRGRRRWRLASRLNSFLGAGGAATPAEAIRAQAAVPGIDSLEINFPQHLRRLPETELSALLAETGLRLTGVNLRFDDPAFARGAFSHPVPAVREQAVQTAQAAVEFAARRGADHVVLWMEGDGAGDPFAIDDARAWVWEVDGVRRVAAHMPAVRVSVEYKPAARGERFVPLVRSMGEALLLAGDVGLPNVGVTLDLCHALMAGERPAAAAALALGRGRLFGVHLNDGRGERDDGLPVGSVDPVRTFEVLAALRRSGYAGTIYFDTFPPAPQAAAECAANVRAVRRFEAMLDDLGSAGVEGLWQEPTAGLTERLRAAGFEPGGEGGNG